MAKRKSRRKKLRSKGPAKGEPKSPDVHVLEEQGFDFGIERRALVAASPEFISLLKEADIVGCWYGIAAGPWRRPVPQISLIAANADPLRRAFVEFRRWDSDDGDAVKLTFVIPATRGGYLLAIEREYTRANYALTGLDRFFTHLLVSGAYAKRLDTQHTFVHDFRRYLEGLGIAPFFFGASSIEQRRAPSPGFEDVKPVTDVSPLLKFEAEFVDEANLKPGTLFSQLLTGTPIQAPVRKSKRRGKRSEKRESGPEEQTPADYARRRESILNRHFPVTIERLRSERFSAIIENVCREGIERWQFEQAICNLLLSTDILAGKRFYAGIPSDDLVAAIAHAANAREESSQTPLPTNFSPDQVIAQVRLDAIALLESVGKSPLPSELTDVQSALRDLGLLERSNA